MKKSKYKIVEDYMGDINKYCEYCGKKNTTVPLGFYDTKSGKPVAELRCLRSDCSEEGERNLEYQRQSSCSHAWKTNWPFPNGRKCQKCGMSDSFKGDLI